MTTSSRDGISLGLDTSDPSRSAKPGTFDNVALCGLSHRTTDARGLGGFARDRAARERASRQLLAQGLREVMLLTTCNRVEVLYAHDGETRARENAARILGTVSTGGDSVKLPAFFALDGQDAVAHLFEVSTSIDSLVVGEKQILRQLRDAVAEAESYGSLGPRLRSWTSEAFRVARQARRTTGLRRGASVVSLATDRLERAAAGAPGFPIALVGAGDMTEQAALALTKRSIAPLCFVNRTLEKARRLADRFSGSALPVDRFLSIPPAVAAVVTATSAPASIFTRVESENLRAARAEQGLTDRLLIVDLAVPFDVDESLRHDRGLDIVTIDDLRAAADERVAEQAQGIERTREILTLRLRRLVDRHSGRLEARAFGRARARGEVAARREASLLWNSLGSSDPGRRERLTRWAVEASHRFAHAARDGNSDAAGSLMAVERARFDRALGLDINTPTAEAWFTRSAKAIANALVSSRHEALTQCS